MEEQNNNEVPSQEGEHPQLESCNFCGNNKFDLDSFSARIRYALYVFIADFLSKILLI